MSTHGYFNAEGLQRLQKILDETCDDLGIARNSTYAMTSREFLGKELFRVGAGNRSDARRRDFTARTRMEEFSGFGGGAASGS